MKTRAFVPTVAALFCLSSYPAICGETAGIISGLLLLADYPDRVFVRVTGTNNSLPACSTVNNRYVLDTSTNTGRQLYALLLAAKHTNAPVTVVGFGTCNLVGNSEDLRGVDQL
jgi:hypothetical protein